MYGLKAIRRSFETAEEVVREWRKKSELERRHCPGPYRDSHLIPSLWDKVYKLKEEVSNDYQS